MKKKIIILAIAVLLTASVATGVFLFYSNQSVKLRKQLDLGYKYLLEQNYEQAIVAYKKALAIDDTSVEAYLGIADSYVGMDDIEAGIAMLQKGIEFFEGLNDLESANILEKKLADLEMIIQEDVVSDIIEDEEKKQDDVKLGSVEVDLSNLNSLINAALFKGKYFTEWTFEEIIKQCGLLPVEADHYLLPLEINHEAGTQYQSAGITSDFSYYQNVEIFMAGDVEINDSRLGFNFYGNGDIVYQVTVSSSYVSLPESEILSFAEENGIVSAEDAKKYLLPEIKTEELYNSNGNQIILHDDSLGYVYVYGVTYPFENRSDGYMVQDLYFRFEDSAISDRISELMIHTGPTSNVAGGEGLFTSYNFTKNRNY